MVSNDVNIDESIASDSWFSFCQVFVQCTQKSHKTSVIISTCGLFGFNYTYVKFTSNGEFEQRCSTFLFLNITLPIPACNLESGKIYRKVNTLLLSHFSNVVLTEAAAGQATFTFINMYSEHFLSRQLHHDITESIIELLQTP